MYPASTYRLQLHKGFTFDDAAAIADYLKELGSRHVYSSPYLQAAPEQHARLRCRRSPQGQRGARRRRRPRTLLQGAGRKRPRPGARHRAEPHEPGRAEPLLVGRAGERHSSRYASFFDIDWNSAEERLRDKVLVPILADQYGRVLQRGRHQVLQRDGSIVHRRSRGPDLSGRAAEPRPSFLNRAAEYARSDTLNFLSRELRRGCRRRTSDGPAHHAGAPSRQGRARRSAGAALRRGRAVSARPSIALSPSSMATPTRWTSFLNQQNYRLAYWKTADQQLGYRRFFDVNTLIGLRVEREYVFEETHALILKWLKARRARRRARRPSRRPARSAAVLPAPARTRAGGWIVGEKILAPGEWLRDELAHRRHQRLRLPEHGAGSARDTAKACSGSASTTQISPATDRRSRPSRTTRRSNVEQEALGSDVNRLTNLFVDICECNREQRDFTRAEIRRAIREVACLLRDLSHLRRAGAQRDHGRRPQRHRARDAVRQRQSRGHRRRALRLHARCADAEGDAARRRASSSTASSSSPAR